MKKIKLILTLSILITGLFAVINQYENSYSTINNINTPFPLKKKFAHEFYYLEKIPLFLVSLMIL